MNTRKSATCSAQLGATVTLVVANADTVTVTVKAREATSYYVASRIVGVPGPEAAFSTPMTNVTEVR